MFEGLRRIVLRIKWSLQFEGLAGTAVGVLTKVLQFMGTNNALLAKCVRHREELFDTRFGIETRDHVPVEQLGISNDRMALAVEYAPSTPVHFCSNLCTLDLVYENYVFVDLGSGKGRVALLASEFPFRRIIGVEVSELLHDTALRNVAAYKSKTKKCRDIHLIRSDVVNFLPPTEPTVFYLFNPFRGEILEGILRNIRNSLIDAPRHVIIIYFNPVHRDLLDSVDFLTKRQSADPTWAVYESSTNYLHSDHGHQQLFLAESR